MTPKILKIASYLIAAGWTVAWGYSASKMLSLYNFGLAPITMPLEILLLISWAALQGMAGLNKFRNVPVPFLVAEGELGAKAIRTFKRARLMSSWVPLGFATFLGLLYLITVPFSLGGSRRGLSAAMPAEICFAPMVFVFFFLSKKTETYQDRVITKAQLAANSESKD